jgi:hypothetical protein
MERVVKKVASLLSRQTDFEPLYAVEELSKH